MGPDLIHKFLLAANLCQTLVVIPAKAGIQSRKH
jgi:hypothetical protein